MAQAGFCFHVLPADVDESFDEGLKVLDAARQLAERKVRAAANLAARDYPDEAHWIIGGDTLVVLGPDPTPGGPNPIYLGKPRDEQHAMEMLEMLSGIEHRVVTGVSVLRQDVPGQTNECEKLSAAEVTFVKMRTISQAEREAYVASGEWKGKAGGYAIQESADAFVTKLRGGGFDNVVGLPVQLTKSLLQKMGWNQED